MAYATEAELIAEFSGTAEIERLCDRDPGQGVNSALLQAALDAASGQMDGIMARRYAVPIVTTGHVGLAAILKRICLDIAIYRLVASRRDLISDARAKLYDDSINWLNGLNRKDSAGDYVNTLPSVSPLATPVSVVIVSDFGFGDADVSSDSATRVFSRESMATI